MTGNSLDHSHPANVVRWDDRDLGGRIADVVTKRFGSISYLVVQTIAVGIWIALNLVAFVKHWDPYPFILLNLVFSTQASYAAPLILLAQNRQDERDRIKAEVDYEHNTEALELLRQIAAGEIVLAVAQVQMADAVLHD